MLIRLAFDPPQPDSPKMDAVQGDSLDLNASGVTVEALVEWLNTVFTFWNDNLGSIYSESDGAFNDNEGVEQQHADDDNDDDDVADADDDIDDEVMPGERRPAGAQGGRKRRRDDAGVPVAVISRVRSEDEALFDLGKLQLRFPPCFGLALDDTEKFRVLGFRSPTEPTIVKQTGLGGAWVVGNAEANSRALIATPQGQNAQTLFTTEATVNVVRTTYDSLFKAWRIESRKSAPKPDKEPAAYLLRPRLIICPNEFRFVVDLEPYKFPRRHANKLTMLVGLTRALNALGDRLFGVRSGYKITGCCGTRDSIKVEPLFDASKPVAWYSMSATFGSTALANKFGLTITHFKWSGPKRPHHMTNFVANSIDANVQSLTDREQHSLNIAMSNIVRAANGPLTAATGQLAIAAIRQKYAQAVVNRQARRDAIQQHRQQQQQQQEQQPPREAEAEEEEAEEDEEGEVEHVEPPVVAEVDDDDDDDDDGDGDVPDEGDATFVSLLRPLPHLPRLCEGPAANRLVPAGFPRRFYVVSLDGPRTDYLADVGRVCLAGSFIDSGRNQDSDNPSNKGFVLQNWQSSSRQLEFLVYDADTFGLYMNTTNAFGLVRLVISCRSV